LSGAFIGASGLSAWKGGWKGALTAIILSAVLAMLMFGATLGGAQIVGMIAASIGASAIVSLWSGGALAAAAAARRRRPTEIRPAPEVVIEPPPVEPIAVVEHTRAIEEAERREREEAQRRAIEEAERIAAEMKAAADAAERRKAEQRASEDAVRLAREQREAAEAAQRLAAEMRAAAEEAQRIQAEKDAERRAAQDLQRRMADERARLQRELETALQKKLDEQRAAFDRERAEFEERLEEERRQHRQAPRSLFGTIASWFEKKEVPTTRISISAPRRSASAKSAALARRTPPKALESRPRLLLFERRRGTADTAIPKLRQRGVDVEAVERLVDAADEIHRFRPDAFFIDSELPDFEKSYEMLLQQNALLPFFVTGRSVHAFVPPPTVRYVSFVVRPYDIDELAKIGHDARETPEALLKAQRVGHMPATASVEVSPHAVQRTGSGYDVVCASCRVVFDALETDWCTCLTKERTLVCTNCLTCFCKAAPAYKEKFWNEAPLKLVDRKAGDTQRIALPPNPPVGEVMRPLVLSVEGDEALQQTIHRVCSNLGYGFVAAMNGADGLKLARVYRPNVIIADAFAPKLDGREMCRLLKKEDAFTSTKMIVMSGLYTDTKYRSEALERFDVDDYLPMPAAMTELINVLQKHVEGTTGLPLPRAPYEMRGGDRAYEVCCFNCAKMFDAARAEWCECAGGENTLVCPYCHGCFCKAPAAYRERFWLDAPPSLFEAKMLRSQRQNDPSENPSPASVRRPLVLLVENDENVELIVRTVATTIGFGYVTVANGEEGLAIARKYKPELVLSDAGMPQLDGRELSRILKEDPATARGKAVIITGLYADGNYRGEARDRFKVDDCMAKPVAVDELLRVFRKYLPPETLPTM